jgi:hypothetical protein
MTWPSLHDASMAHDTQRNREILITARQPYTEIREGEALKEISGRVLALAL